MMSGDYGGGYMPNSSQGGSQSPGGGERKAASAALRPVTIKQILIGEQAHTDAEVLIDGVEVGQVTIVAQVVNISQQTVNIVIYLDDGTGRIEARKWFGEVNPEEVMDINGIKECTYVRVQGALKSFGKKRYINATSVRPVSDPHELYFHLQEVVYVTLLHERGPPNANVHQDGQNVIEKGGNTASNISHYAATSIKKENGNDYAEYGPVAQRIMQYIATQPGGEEGAHVGAITRSVGATANEISAAIDSLMDSGALYTTIDESHFKIPQ